VTKLAELETAAVGQQVAAAAAAQGTQFATPDHERDENWKVESQQAQLAAAPPAPEKDFEEPLVSFVQENQDIPLADQPATPDTNPLSDWLSKSALPSSPEIDAPASDDADVASDDFIAAARRAAHAAAQKSILACLAPSAKSARKLNLPFMKAASKPTRNVHTGEKLPPEIKPAVNTNNNKRRALIIAGLLALAAVSVVTFKILGKPNMAASKTIPAPIENTAVPGAKPKQSSAVPAVDETETQFLSSQYAETVPSDNPDGPSSIDEILTGSVPDQKIDATLASIVAEPGTASNEREMPPVEIGSEALRNAAEQGEASAQFIVATRYLDGEGVTQDVTRAAHWYQKAALAGLAPAQYRLATLFERGRGVPQDTATALIWYQRAAEQGNVKAMHNAAVLAAGTEAGKPNYDIAYKWFLAASQNGLKDSQFNLAVLYERGLGTKANVDEALFWYLTAASQNDADARKRADVLSLNLSPLVVESVRAKAKAWVPQQAPEHANVVTIQDPAWQNTNALTQIAPAQSEIEKPAPVEDPVGLTQKLLDKLGFNIGDPDGKMGVRTTNAIRLFQLHSGLKVTGEVTEDLISQLQAKLG
jgi:localization factor PodJL